MTHEIEVDGEIVDVWDQLPDATTVEAAQPDDATVAGWLADAGEV